MNPSNKEVQLRKTCQLYIYVLESLGKEIPDDLEDCAESYDYLINCVDEFAQVLKELDSQTLEKILNNPETSLARDLKNWWQMYQEMEELHRTPEAFI